MRIIAGEFRSRQLWSPPDGSITRPIPDRLKKSLFDQLRGHFEDSNVFDGFAGTGSIGLEALSRGAAHCTFVDRDPFIGEVLAKNIEMLGVEERSELVVGDALGIGSLARCRKPLHLAFMDPPYPLVRDAAGFGRVMAQMSKLIDLLDDTGFAILRTPWPLRHPEGGVGLAPVEEEKPRYRKKGKDRGGWRRDIDRDERSGGRARSPKPTQRVPDEEETVELTDEEIEAEMTKSNADQDAAAEAAGVKLIAAEMSISNAVGPETHAYRGMGVHLYMRKKK